MGMGINETTRIYPSIAPDVYNDADETSESVDVAGFGAVAVVYWVGDIDTTATFELEDSDDNSAFADVIIDATEVHLTATDDNQTYMVELLPGAVRRYVRVHLTTGNGTEGVNAAAFFVLGRADDLPVKQEASVTVLNADA